MKEVKFETDKAAYRAMVADLETQGYTRSHSSEELLPGKFRTREWSEERESDPFSGWVNIVDCYAIQFEEFPEGAQRKPHE